jgi:hypothetical protein
MHYMRVRRHGSLHYKKSSAKKVEYVITESGCFECTSHYKLSNGYYFLTYNYQRKTLHRHVYEEMFGEIPIGLVVRHKCDNRGCINPEHLELGTYKDNSQDMVSRGRSLKGEKHPASKLSDDDIREIRKLANKGVKRKDICVMFGIKNINTITMIKYGHSWGHVI